MHKEAMAKENKNTMKPDQTSQKTKNQNSMTFKVFSIISY